MAKKRKRRRKDDSFGFISDPRLRSDIKTALNFSSYLIDLAAKAKNPQKREIRRVIILYVASVVEALSLFLINRKGLLREKVEYKYPQIISIPHVTVSAKKELVIALQEKISLPLTETPLFDAINTLRKGGVITATFCKRLHALRYKRNSQHLYGRASKYVSATDVNKALSVLQGLFRKIKQN